MPKILIIDNYDSFTFNLVHLIEKIIQSKVDVMLNDQIDWVMVNQYDKIVLSPGPGIPDEAGSLKNLIIEFANKKPILGVCLGHQAIAEVFGAKLKNLTQVFHGVSTDIFIKDNFSPLFKGLDSPQKVGRYHSWVVDQADLPDSLKITATDEFGNIMGLRHENLNIEGVQFHPESIMTECGERIIRNWLLN